MKTLGVLGGMGPAATLDFLARLQAETPAARDQDHIRVLVDLNPHVPDRNAGDAAPGPALAVMARGLEGAGAEVLAIACNTAHAWADAVRAGCGLPLIDMIDCAVAEARLTGARRVGVLGTVLAQDLYSQRLRAAGLEPVALSADGQARFMELLYRIKAGVRGEAERTGMRELALSLAGAEAVIAGCTEVPLVLDAAALPPPLPIPLIDAGAALARRCVAICRDQP